MSSKGRSREVELRGGRGAPSAGTESRPPAPTGAGAAAGAAAASGESYGGDAGAPVVTRVRLRSSAQAHEVSGGKLVQFRPFTAGTRLFSEDRRPHTVESVPEELQGTYLLCTPNSDLHLTRLDYLGFRVEQTCAVFVLTHEHDDHEPEWLRKVRRRRRSRLVFETRACAGGGDPALRRSHARHARRFVWRNVVAACAVAARRSQPRVSPPHRRSTSPHSTATPWT